MWVTFGLFLVRENVFDWPASQHDHGLQRRDAVEPAGAADDEFDLGVERLRACVVDSQPDGLEDAVTVLADRAAQLDELGNAAPLGSGQEQVEQLGDETHQRLNHRGDVWPGQSDGPFFAWWDGEDWPTLVCGQSGETPSQNSSSGGGHMVECISRARADLP